MTSSKYYSVRKGNQIGIFRTWDECQKSVKGYSGAEYKSFQNLEDAERYLGNKLENVVPNDINKINDNEMIAYVDGSYDSNIGYYSYGAITFFKGERKEFSGRGNDKALLDMRNVSGEIMAAQAAMAYAVDKQVEKLYLYYDYEGIEKWATSAWQAKKEGTKQYKAYYDKISKKLEVKFIKVKAHTGDKYNEEVDALARKGLLSETEDQKSLNEATLVSSKVNSKSFVPTFNIAVSNNGILNTDSIINDFKEVWKNKKKNLKDIKELKILLDIDNMKAMFNVETDDENYEIEIELK